MSVTALLFLSVHGLILTTHGMCARLAFALLLCCSELGCDAVFTCARSPAPAGPARGHGRSALRSAEDWESDLEQRSAWTPSVHPQH